MPGRRLTPEDKSQLRQLWPLGWTHEALAAELEITPSTVRRLASNLDLPPRSSGRGRPPSVTESSLRRLRDLWRAGQSADAIASDLGFSKSTVFRHAALMGLSARAYRNHRKERLRELWGTGQSAKVIAGQLSLSETTVRRYAAAMKLQKRSRKIPRKFDARMDRRLKYLWGEGIRGEELVRCFSSVHRATVYVRRKKLGLRDRGGETAT